MAQRTCTLDGCDKPHRARGLCSTHYNQRKPEYHPKVERTCEMCGTAYRTPRTDGRFCSLLCRDVWRLESGTNPEPPRTKCVLPKDHPVRVLIRENAVRKSPIRSAYEREDWPQLIEAIRAHCVSVDDCWLWARGLKKKYPWIGIAGKTMLVHRLVAMAMREGRLFTSEPVHHKCGEPMCVRPEHLQVVTPIENTAEMLERHAYQRRIAELEAALASEAPGHPLLTLRRISPAA